MNTLNETELLQANGGFLLPLLKGAGRLIIRNPKTVGGLAVIGGIEIADNEASKKKNEAKERYDQADQKYVNEYARLAGDHS